MTRVENVPQHGRMRSEATTELRRTLGDHSGSAVAKYRALNVGRPGLGALVNYELRTMVLGSIPGALGYALRQKLYRGLFGDCGRGVVIGRNVTIRHPHRIQIGDHVVIDDNCVLDGKSSHDIAMKIGNDAIIGRNTILSCKGGTIELGEHANISVNCTIISETHVSLGRKVLLAGHCYVIAGGNHGIDRIEVPIIDQECEQRGGVVIEDHAWLGASVTVLDGVRLGRDSVVAAGAVVTRDVAPFAVVGGVPARLLRDRRSEETASRPREQCQI